MANPSYTKDGKTYLQCKECCEFKELIPENWYYHKLGYLGVSGRCRKCILKGRSSEREHIMSRKRDFIRNHNNPKRKEYLRQASKERAKRHEENGEKRNELHKKTIRLINKLQNRPKECPICGNNKSKILAHHPKLENRREIVFCCPVCHSKIHNGKITNYKITNLKENPSNMSTGELIQLGIDEKCRLLRQRTAPPSWMNQSEDGYHKWRSI